MSRRSLAVVAAVALVGLTGVFLYSNLRPEGACAACYRAIHDETHVVAHLADGSVEHVCCPRCAIRYQKERDDVTGVDVTDFDGPTKILDAGEAFFVEGSDVVLCRHEPTTQKDRSGAQYALTWDRCLPSLVAFSTRDAAEAFQSEFGGEVRTYAELLREDF